MPDGSSSDAPVIRPGPSAFSASRKRNGRAGAAGLSAALAWTEPGCLMGFEFGLRSAMPRVLPSDNGADERKFRERNYPMSLARQVSRHHDQGYAALLPVDAGAAGRVTR